MRLHRTTSDDEGDAEETATARTVRHLLDFGAAAGSERAAVALGAELQRTCLRITTNLRDALGDDGCDALLVRALARTESAHPALKDIRRIHNDGIRLDNVAESIDLHGIGVVTNAVAALLTALIDTLSRLVGEDMAIALIDQNPPRAPRGEGRA